MSFYKEVKRDRKERCMCITLKFCYCFFVSSTLYTQYGQT